MQPPHQHSRMNLAELKAQIVRKLGPDRSKQYFYYLNRLLSLKISKVELSKICLRIFGRENIPLQNQFIRSILKNACSAKVPPSSHEDEFLKPGSTLGNNEASNDVYEQNGSRVSVRQSSSQPGLSNGDFLPLSPRKARTGFRDRRAGDGRSALGPNEKDSLTFQHSTAEESSDFEVTKENGDLNPPDSLRSVQHNLGLIQRDGRDAANLETSKLSLIKRPLEGPVSVHNKDQVSGDGKEMHARNELQAPLGVPFYPVSTGGSHRELPLETRRKCFRSSNFDALLDTLTLRERMEQIAAEQGIEGVAVNCANLVNNGLDSYLKGLIGSCVQLLGARSGHEQLTKISKKKQQTYTKPVNGLRPGHHIQVSSDKSSEFMQEQAPDSLVSSQDFRVAMELNRQQHGKDWTLLLEKVCARVSEE